MGLNAEWTKACQDVLTAVFQANGTMGWATSAHCQVSATVIRVVLPKVPAYADAAPGVVGLASVKTPAAMAAFPDDPVQSKVVVVKLRMQVGMVPLALVPEALLGKGSSAVLCCVQASCNEVTTSWTMTLLVVTALLLLWDVTDETAVAKMA